MDPGSWAVRLGPRCFSVESVDSFRISVVVAPPPLFTHQIKAEPYRCSRRVASIIERIELGSASNLVGVFICLTAPPYSLVEIILM
jgi:hypothetical protein